MNRLSLVAPLFLACAVFAQTPNPTPKPASTPTKSVGTWILQIEGDARGLKVVGVSHKSATFRAQRRMRSQFHLQLFDAKGKRLKSIPIDLTDFCMDPAHVGKKDHIRGNQIIQHKVCMTFKIPALAEVAEVRITKVTGATPTVYGKIDRKTIVALATAGGEVR